MTKAPLAKFKEVAPKLHTVTAFPRTVVELLAVAVVVVGNLRGLDPGPALEDAPIGCPRHRSLLVRPGCERGVLAIEVTEAPKSSKLNKVVCAAACMWRRRCERRRFSRLASQAEEALEKGAQEWRTKGCRYTLLCISTPPLPPDFTTPTTPRRALSTCTIIAYHHRSRWLANRGVRGPRDASQRWGL